jgi:hypothetical protein
LAELLEDVLALLGRDAGADVVDAQCKVAVGCSGRDAHLAGVRELDGVTNEMSST